MDGLFNSEPARDIGITNRSVSGIVPGMGKYESSLERDFMEISRFDPAVELLIPQPVTIKYKLKSGAARSYTPDGLIRFSPELAIPPVLYEIKFRSDFRENWKTILPKFRAAKDYGLSHGWHFKVFTEREIRTPYLDNVKFLWPYQSREPSKVMKEHVIKTLWDLDESDPDMLLCALCSDEGNRARMIPVVWHLIANSIIGCDLNQPLTMRSKIWPTENNHEND